MEPIDVMRVLAHDCQPRNPRVKYRCPVCGATVLPPTKDMPGGEYIGPPTKQASVKFQSALREERSGHLLRLRPEKPRGDQSQFPEIVDVIEETNELS